VADPPTRIGRKPKSSTVVEPLNGFHQTDVALLDQIGEGHATVIEASRDTDHQPQIRLDELIASH
jgi:hypothetical protein